MKKVIELLEKAEAAIMLAFSGTDEADLCTEAINHINDAMDELKAPPRWETPEQWEKRTGEKWPDDWAVYYRQKEHGTWTNWYVVRLSYAITGGSDIAHQIICATEAGPPPKGWKPKE